METLIINGGKTLRGDVEINGAKNAAVAILPAAILASEGKCIIDNIPDIEDVHTALMGRMAGEHPCSGAADANISSHEGCPFRSR